MHLALCLTRVLFAVLVNYLELHCYLIISRKIIFYFLNWDILCHRD